MQETNTVTYAQEVKDKTEKIVAGLHVLTNHLPDNNLLKSEIRNTAVSLLSSVLEDKESVQYVTNLSSFIRVATLAQDISKENATIIAIELGKVRGTRDTHDLQDIFTVSKDTHNVRDSQTILPKHSSANLALGDVPHRDIELDTKDSEPPTIITGREIKQDYTTTMSQTPHQSFMKKDTSINMKDMLKGASPRRLKVVGLLSHTDAKSIKDVSRHFNDVSEKTIQRELNDMVDAKIIVRIGDRRWSMYKLR